MLARGSLRFIRHKSALTRRPWLRMLQLVQVHGVTGCVEILLSSCGAATATIVHISFADPNSRYLRILVRNRPAQPLLNSSPRFASACLSSPLSGARRRFPGGSQGRDALGLGSSFAMLLSTEAPNHGRISKISPSQSEARLGLSNTLGEANTSIYACFLGEGRCLAHQDSV